METSTGLFYQRYAVGVRQQKVAVQDLTIGSFVSDLDRPWHETPFPIQGFYIRTQEDIRSLTSYCRWVMVDVTETRDTSEYEASNAPIFSRRSSKRHQQETLKLPAIQVRNRQEYPVASTLKREARQGKRLMQDIAKTLSAIERQVRAGQTPDFAPVSRVARGMASSVVRHPDAMLWVSRLHQHDNHSYRHALNASVWALVCGRHMGLERPALENLALGTLLCQIGKLDLPVEVVRNEHKLDADDFALFRRYVDKGVERLEAAGLSRAVVNVVRYHRERHNGSGFPERVRGDRIPLLAKIAGLVDHYETLVEPRADQMPLTPAQAVAHLYELRNIEFQEDLVEHFIQSIGVYPTGTLVQLSSGERGAVVAHSPGRRLWPRVMVMTDRDQKPLKTARVVNLAELNEGRQPEDALSVSGCLPFGADGLDPRHFEVTGAASRWSFRHLIG
ncbi:HD-GYP domain-containing protein [Marinobacter sp. JSM 1782161]|uniref:HD-GYP domain-containing protein n=1 Tax=Marinobacter sp. JSM 1782161 TaxID=2685906 RepID=UPI001A9F8343|nr:HD domain-containing phosphohydrolase [Marinobacter sp. JSM 1782161]